MKISTNKIDYLVAGKGLSGKALAEKAGVSPQTLSVIRGRGTCSPETGAKLATALGVDIFEIIAEDK